MSLSLVSEEARIFRVVQNWITLSLHRIPTQQHDDWLSINFCGSPVHDVSSKWICRYWILQKFNSKPNWFYENGISQIFRLFPIPSLLLPSLYLSYAQASYCQLAAESMWGILVQVYWMMSKCDTLWIKITEGRRGRYWMSTSLNIFKA